MPRLLIRNPDGSELEHAFSGELTVGRADGNGLVLQEGGVSRRHARFFEEGDAIVVEDLGSANGTWVDGERIEAPTPIGPRAQVVLGDYELSLASAAPSRRAPARPAGSRPSAVRPPEGATTQRPQVRAVRATRQLSALERRAALGQKDAGEAPGASGEGEGLARRSAVPRPAAQAITGPTLRGITGPWANKLYPIRDVVVVGRVPGVQIQIEDESVSRRHAELERTADGVLLRDLDSANGTLVNGGPVEGEVILQPGDVVQFGMIELSYEVGDGASSRAPTRRGGARPPSGPRRAVASGEEGAGKRKRLLVVAAASVGVLLVAGVVAKVGGGADAPPANVPMLPPDPTAQIQELLSECRTYGTFQYANEPDWDRAEAACNKALDLDPINGEATSLIKKIRIEKDAAKNFAEGERLLGLLREEAALDLFAKIPSDSVYYQRVKPRAREAIAAVQKKAKEDCTQYARGGNWAEALPRCERYMTFACQSMTEEALLPPPGYELDLWGRRSRKAWRPKDPMYLNLLRARDKQDPNAGPWMCPPVEMYKSDIVVIDPKAEVKRVLKARFSEPLMYDAMVLYWDGAGGEAVTKLQRLRDSRDKVELHSEAHDLLRSISNVENLYKKGATALGTRDFDQAAATFREALSIDQKLMLDLAETRPSFFRRTIEQDMAQETYAGGKHWADRDDPRRACRIWKLGYSFFKGNADLIKALAYCSRSGFNALRAAQNCADLETVLEFAAGEDGLKEKVAEKRAEWQCG